MATACLQAEPALGRRSCFPAIDPEACVRTVVAIAAVESGATIREAARLAGSSYAAIYRTLAPYGASVARRRKPRIDRGTKQRIAGLVREEILGVREIAREVGVSPDSVCIVARQVKRRPRPTSHAKAVAPYRCECGHVVAVSPCVICAAKGGAAKAAA